MFWLGFFAFPVFAILVFFVVMAWLSRELHGTWKWWK